MSANGEQTAQVAAGGRPQADLVAVRQKVDRISIWLFRRIPLGALAVLVVYIALRLADSSGREQWRAEAPKEKPFLTLTVSSGGIHALRTDGFCQTFDAQTGAFLWETRLCDRLEYDAHLMASNDLLLATSAEGLWVLDPARGTVLYKQEDEAGDPARIVILDRRLLLASEPGGRFSWRRLRDKDATNVQDRLTGEDDPALTCVDFASGKVAWKRPFKGRHITRLAGEGDLCVCASEVPQAWDWKPCAKHQKTRMRYGRECPDCVSRWIPASDRKIEVIDTTSGLTRWHCELKGGDFRHVEMKTGRLLVITNQRIYTIGADGREVGRTPWVSSNLTETLVISDRVLGVEAQGGIRAASMNPPAPAWNCSPRGYLHDVAADNSTVFISTIEEGDRPDQEAADATPTAHAQLTRELWGEGEGEPRSGGATRRVLSALDPSDGRARWRKEDLLGRIVPYDDMFLRITEGYQTALIFPDGGTVLYAHLARNGRQVWYSKIPFAVHDIILLPERIVAIAEKRGSGSGLFGYGKAEFSAVVSLNRRSLLNRLMRP